MTMQSIYLYGEIYRKGWQKFLIEFHWIGLFYLFYFLQFWDDFASAFICIYWRKRVKEANLKMIKY